jgi:hypothetical protein
MPKANGKPCASATALYSMQRFMLREAVKIMVVLSAALSETD